ncbi:hypothetical protein B0J18DRAFT_417532 [Chaetomium sp. MPI-SDFR-AT-0129]|nr:hypothetical protein B0J18DRAFT_417532 [Chaetomium sp. MPI-SDFR-AT-0129]
MPPPFLGRHTTTGSDVLTGNPPGCIRHHQQDSTGNILRVTRDPVGPSGEGEFLGDLVLKVTIREPTAGVRGGGAGGNRVDRDAMAGTELGSKSMRQILLRGFASTIEANTGQVEGACNDGADIDDASTRGDVRYRSLDGVQGAEGVEGKRLLSLLGGDFGKQLALAGTGASIVDQDVNLVSLEPGQGVLNQLRSALRRRDIGLRDDNLGPEGLQAGCYLGRAGS